MRRVLVAVSLLLVASALSFASSVSMHWEGGLSGGSTDEYGNPIPGESPNFLLEVETGVRERVGNTYPFVVLWANIRTDSPEEASIGARGGVLVWPVPGISGVFLKATSGMIDFAGPHGFHARKIVGFSGKVGSTESKGSVEVAFLKPSLDILGGGYLSTPDVMWGFRLDARPHPTLGASFLYSHCFPDTSLAIPEATCKEQTVYEVELGFSFSGIDASIWALKGELKEGTVADLTVSATPFAWEGSISAAGTVGPASVCASVELGGIDPDIDRLMFVSEDLERISNRDFGIGALSIGVGQFRMSLQASGQVEKKYVPPSTSELSSILGLEGATLEYAGKAVGFSDLWVKSGETPEGYASAKVEGEVGVQIGSAGVKVSPFYLMESRPNGGYFVPSASFEKILNGATLEWDGKACRLLDTLPWATRALSVRFEEGLLLEKKGVSCSLSLGGDDLGVVITGSFSEVRDYVAKRWVLPDMRYREYLLVIALEGGSSEMRMGAKSSADFKIPVSGEGLDARTYKVDLWGRWGTNPKVSAELSWVIVDGNDRIFPDEVSLETGGIKQDNRTVATFKLYIERNFGDAYFFFRYFTRVFRPDEGHEHPSWCRYQTESVEVGVKTRF